MELARDFSRPMTQGIRTPTLGSKCEQIRSAYAGADGEWNEKSEALLKVRLLCGDCYEEIKTRNILSTESVQ
jgi:hypothetical protein